MPAFVKKVYETMYASMSNGNVVKPKLILDYENKEQVVSYIPSSNEVKIGTKFITVCRSFGKDSTNALAHVLGHELAHILLQQNDFVQQIGSGYASKEINKQMKSLHKTLRDSVFERQADEFAALYAHIAGYNTVKIGEKVLDSIYYHFNLKDKDLTKYPTLKERKGICTAVASRMNVLKSLFDYANLATLAGNYDFAEACYKTIIKEKFPSREIYNNLSVVFLLKAINEIDTVDFPYVLPIELDFKSRLYTNERSIFSNYEENLQEAIRLADLALGNKKEYDKAWLNKGIAEFLLEKKEDAQYSLYKAMMVAEANTKNSINIMNAIFEHKFGNWEVALEKLSVLGKLSDLAKKNYLILTKGNNINAPKEITSSFLSSLSKISMPKFDFESEDAKISDTLKNVLVFDKNMQLRTLNSLEFIARQGKHLVGDVKPIFTIFELKTLPEFTFQNEIMKELVKFTKSENRSYYLYKNWILDIENEKLKNCYLIKK